ncbi:MAG: HD-GYP domain-containing protein [Oscillospiraceae bacterium]
MEVLYTCKMQIALLIFLMFFGILFIKQGNRLNKKSGKELCNKHFDSLFIIAEIAVVFDGITVYTVNHLDSVPAAFNLVAHTMYLVSLQLFVFEHFVYWLNITGTASGRGKRLACMLPQIFSLAATLLTMPFLYYVEGEYTNYSMGIPVYICFADLALYTVLTIVFFLRKSAYIEHDKKISFTMAIIISTVIWLVQIIFHETLLASLAVTLIVTSLYLIMENPSVKEAKLYHREMIMGFSTLVENKDNNTGGHIKRTSMYAEIIARELRKDMHYHYLITKDFMDNLIIAAPMHDIGKIGIPDVILNKPGKLDDEEYAIMKTHSAIGAQIINDTFGHTMDDEYKDMAYQVALYHHEKWNGRGYPEGLKETEIPLCARIMAVADVFDAVSAKRCYRDAMPLEKCYAIIREGRGKDFDPDVVDAFFRCIDEIERVAKTANSGG